MNSIDTWGAIAVLTVATVITRGAFFLLGNKVKIPIKVQHALRYAPAAALAAIIAPDIILGGGVLDISWMNPKLMASIGATIFFVLTRHLLGTIVFGMGLFTVLRLMM